MDQAIAEAVERPNAVMRELSQRAFPKPDVVPGDAARPLRLKPQLCAGQPSSLRQLLLLGRRPVGWHEPMS
ncbi:hypothetical protein [Streptomyces antnestii]|uniref:hypothetical protein n=1 Tax=Streptomyces antnestii TaxID=2494256 RepID=UPI00294FFD63|nr:hypothetical protein [Streptomyces sp. San01]